MIGKTIIRLLVMSACLAVYELFVKPLYYSYLQERGSQGFGTVMIGYFAVLLVGYIISRLVVRGWGSD